MREPFEHSHPLDTAYIKVARSKAKIRDRAINSDERTSNIIQRETQDLSLAIAGLHEKNPYSVWFSGSAYAHKETN